MTKILYLRFINYYYIIYLKKSAKILSQCLFCIGIVVTRQLIYSIFSLFCRQTIKTIKQIGLANVINDY